MEIQQLDVERHVKMRLTERLRTATVNRVTWYSESDWTAKDDDDDDDERMLVDETG